jgi:cytochrome c oxidase assembly protein subunit 11
MSEKPKSEQTGNTKLVSRLMLIVVGMFGFGFALVPLYNVFCDLTGLNGKTANEASAVEMFKIDENRNIKVEFLASLNEDMPWEFKAKQESVVIHPGKPVRIEYMVKNKTDRDIVGQAIPSVSPGLAAKYFQKTECFCFTEQVLKAGEEKTMPVVFVVDPSLSEDIGEITLSYTFFIKPGTEGADRGVNVSSVSKALANIN